MCGLLRDYVNDTADIANRAAALVSGSPDPVARRDAVRAGFDELIKRSEQHRDTVGAIDAADLYLGDQVLPDLLGGAEHPLCPLGGILRDAFPVEVHQPELALRLGVALLGQRAHVMRAADGGFRGRGALPEMPDGSRGDANGGCDDAGRRVARADAG